MYKIIIAILFLLGLINFSAVSQNINSTILGKWKVENLIFDFTSDEEEKIKVHDECINVCLSISDSTFIVKDTNKCPLLKNDLNFRYTKKDTLFLENASKKYSEKAVYYIFNDGKRKEIEVYSINFKLSESSEENMEILAIDDDDLILYLDLTLIFVHRVK